MRIKARGGYDAFMESVPPVDGVTFEPDTLGGIRGVWVHPAEARQDPRPGQHLCVLRLDKYNLTPRAVDIISQAAADSKTAQTTTIDVNGYTDTSGTSDCNMGLSWRRAKAVATQLVADGVPASEIQTQGFGETHLLVPTGPGVREPTHGNRLAARLSRFRRKKSRQKTAGAFHVR